MLRTAGWDGERTGTGDVDVPRTRRRGRLRYLVCGIRNLKPRLRQPWPAIGLQRAEAVPGAAWGRRQTGSAVNSHSRPRELWPGSCERFWQTNHWVSLARGTYNFPSWRKQCFEHGASRTGGQTGIMQARGINAEGRRTRRGAERFEQQSTRREFKQEVTELTEENGCFVRLVCDNRSQRGTVAFVERHQSRPAIHCRAVAGKTQ